MPMPGHFERRKQQYLAECSEEARKRQEEGKPVSELVHRMEIADWSDEQIRAKINERVDRGDPVRLLVDEEIRREKVEWETW